MKTLSIINPWAHLIMYHGKNIENRSQKTNYRGRILIHVPKTILRGYKSLLYDLIDCGVLDKKKFDDEEYKRIEAEFGMIIGSVELYDCDFGIINKPWGENGLWHWKLRDPIPLEKPVPARGSLGLWDYKGEL
jgi:hypothetical protein